MEFEVDRAKLCELIDNLGHPLTPWQEVLLGIRRPTRGTSVRNVKRGPYRTTAYVGKPVPEVEAAERVNALPDAELTIEGTYDTDG